MDTARWAAALAWGALTVTLALRSLNHAAVGYGLVQHRIADRPRAVGAMVWALTLVGLFGLGAVAAGALTTLSLAVGPR